MNAPAKEGLPLPGHVVLCPFPEVDGCLAVGGIPLDRLAEVRTVGELAHVVATLR